MPNETPFSKNAEMYRDEKVFAEGEDLAMLIKTAECRAEQRVLDVGAGAGHTALAFSPYVQECIGIDATQEMVDVALSFAEEKGAFNVHFQKGTAEELPFLTIHLMSSPADMRLTTFPMFIKPSVKLHA